MSGRSAAGPSLPALHSHHADGSAGTQECISISSFDRESASAFSHKSCNYLLPHLQRCPQVGKFLFIVRDKSLGLFSPTMFPPLCPWKAEAATHLVTSSLSFAAVAGISPPV